MEAHTHWLAENRSLDRAERWQLRVEQLIDRLGDQPEQHPLAHESPHFAFELRELLVKTGRRPTHRILFRIIGATVQVLAVHHTSQADVRPDDLD